MGFVLDHKMLAGGFSMIVVGVILVIMINASMPLGQTNMTEEETLDLLLAQQETEDYTTLSGILIAVGFLLAVISFGAKRKRRGGIKKVNDKPVGRV